MDNKKKSFLSLFIGVAIIFAITLATTFYVGANWGRWNSFAGIDEAGELIRSIPLSVGDWKAEEDRTLDITSVNMLELASYIVRHYKNARTGESVSVILMIGPTGRLAVHTPAVCFGGRNYQSDGPAVRVKFTPTLADSEENTFWRHSFTNNAYDGDCRVFYYALSTGNNWLALDNPRFELSNFRYLYKLHCEAIVPAGTNFRDNGDVISRFLKDFLPEIQPYLIGHE